MPIIFRESLGWILGSLASALNFWWLAQNIKKCLDLFPAKAKELSLKGTYLRFVFLLVYSVLLIGIVKPNIFSFGLGLLSAQIVIYLHELITRFKDNRYFRG
ncbi:MAG: ATP synthase subunit I [Candidatus Cloacimonetes bacterium]|nr:ATP synthase subunit I [Candidatus Cloacimonadota bacterium]